MMHYQFETIHPFLDGNGRIGRLLVGLLLVQEKRLSRPMLYISGYLESHRREYYDLLQGVRESGDIQRWLQFFLTAIARSAEDAVHRASRLVTLREQFIAESRKSRSRLPALIDMIFTNPYLTAQRVERALKVTNQGARNLIRDAERLGWVGAPIGIGRPRRLYWLAEEVLTIIDMPFAYEAAHNADDERQLTLTDL